jgi:hypothetical protein
MYLVIRHQDGNRSFCGLSVRYGEACVLAEHLLDLEREAPGLATYEISEVAVNWACNASDAGRQEKCIDVTQKLRLTLRWTNDRCRIIYMFEDSGSQVFRTPHKLC